LSVDERPLLRGDEPLSALRRLLERRKPLYEEVSDYEVDANQDIERVVDELQHIWDSC